MGFVNSIERKNKILELLKREGSVNVDSLTDLLGVSKVTIRTDLDDMEAKGLLIRTHGGAINPDNNFGRILSTNLVKNQEEKIAICRVALEYIKPGMSIIIDSGSTMVHLARLIFNMNIVVITNSILVVRELMDSPTVELVVAGGVLRRPTMSLIGEMTSYTFENIHADLLFLGTPGFSIKKGLYSSSMFEAENKRQMIRQASEIFVLADSSKLENMFIAKVCSWDSIDYLITDHLSDKDKEALALKGVETIIAGV